MDRIADYATKCLATAAKYGEVIIITNSDEGWVQFSAERYIPNLIPIVSKYRIISARTCYEKFYPGQPLCWKAAAFAHEVNESFAAFDRDMPASSSRDKLMFNASDDTVVSTDVDTSDDSQEEDETKSSPRLTRSRKGKKQIRREVISFGDSIEEQTAVKIVSGQLSAIPKSVMFVTSPTPEQLIGQLALLTGHMKHVCESLDTLDLEISPQQAEKCALTILRKNRASSSRRIRQREENRTKGNNNDDTTYSI